MHQTTRRHIPETRNFYIVSFLKHNCPKKKNVFEYKTSVLKHSLQLGSSKDEYKRLNATRY